MHSTIAIREAIPQEFEEIGKLMVKVYSQLEGFPSRETQPEYYRLLLNIGKLTAQKHTKLLVATTKENSIAGAVVYFSDMAEYGSGGTATREKNASGFRLLAVDPAFRNSGIGKKLSIACIERCRQDKNDQLIIHSTRFMQVTWKMYEKLGFKRSPDLDFMQGELPVFGFRLKMDNA